MTTIIHVQKFTMAVNSQAVVVQLCHHKLQMQLQEIYGLIPQDNNYISLMEQEILY